jgi:parvulin-like peptidyl-prolyl isomerase
MRYAIFSMQYPGEIDFRKPGEDKGRRSSILIKNCDRREAFMCLETPHPYLFNPAASVGRVRPIKAEPTCPGKSIHARFDNMKRALPGLSFLILLMTAVMLILSVWNPAHAEIIDGIVAVVDNSVIMHSDLEKRMHDLGATNDDLDAARQVLQLMVEDIIVKKVYQTLGLPQVDLRQAEDAAQKMNIGVADATSFIMKSTLMDIMVKSRVVVTEAMIRKYYESHQYIGKESIHVKQILIKKDTSAKAQQAIDEIRRGISFDEVARKFSDVLVSDSPDIGWVAIDEIAEGARKELESAKPGDVVGPVKLGDNILIYQVIERGVAGGKSIEEVREEIVETLQEQYRKEAFEHWLKMIMADHYIGIFI